MTSIVNDLHKKGFMSAPNFVSGGMQYEVIMGSMAYGVNTNSSDMDIYGFCIPPRDYIFPHLRGEISGFSTPHLAHNFSSIRSIILLMLRQRAARAGNMI